MSDLETAQESLLAHLYAVCALTGVPPRAMLERLLANNADDHTWYTQYLHVIMGDAEDILGEISP